MKKNSYTIDQLKEAVKTSTSVVQVLRRLGVQYRSGYAWRSIRALIASHGIDTSHFKGHGQNKGKKITKLRPESVLTFTDRAYRQSGSQLRFALIQVGVPYVCAKCSSPPEWNGQKLTLQVDHIDGNWQDSRKSNLRFLCPNCHSQEETSSRQKQKRVVSTQCLTCGKSLQSVQRLNGSLLSQPTAKARALLK